MEELLQASDDFGEPGGNVLLPSLDPQAFADSILQLHEKEYANRVHGGMEQPEIFGANSASGSTPAAALNDDASSIGEKGRAASLLQRDGTAGKDEKKAGEDSSVVSSEEDKVSDADKLGEADQAADQADANLHVLPNEQLIAGVRNLEITPDVVGKQWMKVLGL